MTSLMERTKNLFNTIIQGKTRIPSYVTISRNHVDNGSKMGEPFKPNAHYFQVRVNEMYLANSRNWFVEYDPLVFFVSEFIYDKKTEVSPFIVGPSLLKKIGQQVPNGMIFSNTRVAGLHPYKGGRLTLSTVLCRVQRENYAEKLLHLVENTAGVLLNASLPFFAYIKVAPVILDGIETLLGLGDDTDPLLGIRIELDPDAGDVVEPSYFALIDKPEEELDRSQLWVRDNKLVSGNSLESAKPFRDADYVLYSLVQTSERQELQTLPFYSLYEQVKRDALKPDDKSWKQAKSKMYVLIEKLVNSPDLTTKHAEKLINTYLAEMQKLHERALGLGALGEEECDIGQINESNIDATLNKVVEILDSM